MSAPIPAPGLVGTSLKWMTRRDSPLYIRPTLDPAFAAWIIRFWRNCRPGPYAAGLHAVAALNRRTMTLFDHLVADGVRFEMHADGLLFAGLHRSAVARALEEVWPLERIGYRRPELLSGDALRRLEPGLSSAVAGGFLVEEERHVRPESFASGLADWLRERGVALLSGPERAVVGLRRRGSELTALVTLAGDVPADAVVLAAGAWSGALGARLGFAIPVQAGKGYSVTVSRPVAALQRPVDLIEARVACTPFDGALRLAGTMELSGVNLRMRPERLAAIRRAGDRYLAGWHGAEERPWVGMRPLTPDGLPLLGRLPGTANGFVATGHAMLGVTLAPATAEALAQLVLTGSSEANLAPFDPARFTRSMRLTLPAGRVAR